MAVGGRMTADRISCPVIHDDEPIFVDHHARTWLEALGAGAISVGLISAGSWLIRELPVTEPCAFSICVVFPFAIVVRRTTATTASMPPGPKGGGGLPGECPETAGRTHRAAWRHYTLSAARARDCPPAREHPRGPRRLLPPPPEWRRPRQPNRPVACAYVLRRFAPRPSRGDAVLAQRDPVEESAMAQLGIRINSSAVPTRGI